MEKFYRFLLKAYPRQFRDEFGDEMCRLFTKRLRAGLGRRGRFFYVVHAARTVIDTLVGASAERIQHLFGESGSGLRWSGFREDLRLAALGLKRSKAFVGFATITLALGIAGTTTMFTVVNGILLSPLPYPDPDRLARVWGHHPEIGLEVASLPDFVDWRNESSTFATMSGHFRRSLTLRSSDRAIRVIAARVTGDFFSTMGTEPALGRAITESDDVPGGDPVAVLGHAMWLEHFGGSADVLGRGIELDGTSYTIVGVAPSGFEFPEYAEVWLPMALDVSDFGRRSDFVGVTGRLRDGVSVSEAQAELTAISERLAREYPESNARWRARIVPLRDQITGDVRSMLLALLGAVGLVLLVACANVAGLFIAKGMTRTGELSIKAALGASRGRLIRQLLIESTAVGLVGSILGVALAKFGVTAFTALAPPGLPRIDNVKLDLSVSLFAVGAGVAAGMLTGIQPALRLSRGNLASLVSSGSTRQVGTRGSNRLRRLLVGLESALAVVLLIGSGLMFKSLRALTQVEPGYRVENLLTFRTALPRGSYDRLERTTLFYDELEEALGAIPGVEGVATAQTVPAIGGGSYLSFDIVGRPPVSSEVLQDANVVLVGNDYFDVLEIPLLRGRTFGRTDTREARPVAVVSESLARRYFEDEEAVGARITFGGREIDIVGVVGDVKNQGLKQEPYPMVYRPRRQRYAPEMRVLLDTRLNHTSLSSSIRAAVAGVDPGVAIYSVHTMKKLLGREFAESRFAGSIIHAFSILSLALVIVGLYGLTASWVGQRKREIGVRMALGATSNSVATRVIGGAVATVAVGLVVGAIGSVVGARALESQLFGVEPVDPSTYLGVALAVVLASGVAALIPARRAARVDPATTLREE